jgi:hypothetical protein
LGVLEYKSREFDFRSGNLRFITSAYRFHKNYKIDKACQIGHSGIRLTSHSNEVSVYPSYHNGQGKNNPGSNTYRLYPGITCLGFGVLDLKNRRVTWVFGKTFMSKP